ncbi:hypothetical protein GCM10027062_44760 [Nocardioides hungaricus]
MVDDHGQDEPAQSGGASWLPAPCPAWCTRTHGEDDHPEDRVHQGDGTVLPVVFGRIDPWRLRYVPDAGDLVVRLVRDLPASSPTWVVLADSERGERALVLTRESAGLLRAALPGEP